MKYIFIVNPVSGSGKYKKVVNIIEDYFKDKDIYEIIFTKYPGHAKEIAKRYNQGERIYSVGGDGSAHEVLNGLNPECSFGIIPTGSGNDFVKMYIKKMSLKDITIASILGTETLIDVGLANNTKFLNCVNVGLDAEVNVMVNKIRARWFPRKLIYIYAALVQIIKGFKMDIRVDNEDFNLDKSIVLTSIMNGRWYGGGFQSAPFADISDGYLDLCMIDSVPRRRIFPLLPVYFQGKHTELDIVRMEKIKTVCLSSNIPFTYGCDGEIFKDNKVDVSVLERSVALIIPN